MLKSVILKITCLDTSSYCTPKKWVIYCPSSSVQVQTKPNRSPRQFFLLSDIKLQLKYPLEQDGLFEKILSTKKKAEAAKTSDSSTLQDITDGKYYRQLLEDGQFLANENCISGLFKGQINQNFDIFSFNPIYLLCVDFVSNKHILKFQVNWT